MSSVIDSLTASKVIYVTARNRKPKLKSSRFEQVHIKLETDGRIKGE